MSVEESALPAVPPGTILRLAKEDWRYGEHPLLLLVEGVRTDLSTYYDNEWIWISGQRLARDGSPMGHLDALVRVAALAAACPAGPAPHPARPPRQRTPAERRRTRRGADQPDAGPAPTDA